MPNNILVTCTMDRLLNDMLRKEAQEEQVSVSEIIRRALQEHYGIKKTE